MKTQDRNVTSLPDLAPLLTRRSVLYTTTNPKKEKERCQENNTEHPQGSCIYGNFCASTCNCKWLMTPLLWFLALVIYFWVGRWSGPLCFLCVFIWILPMSTKRGPPRSHIKRDYKCQWRISTQQYILGLFQTDDKHQGFHRCINSPAARWGQAGSMPGLTTGNCFFGPKLHWSS